MMVQAPFDRLGATEDGFTERKPDGAKAGEVRQTLLAFANSVPEGRTAVLFVGVADNGSILGVKNADAEQKRIREIAERDCYPPIKIQMEVANDGGRNIVAVVIASSSLRPHFAGQAWVRVGSESKNASAAIYEELIASRCTKAGALIRLKGVLVSVYARRGPLGDSTAQLYSDYLAKHECRVTECTGQHVVLYDISSMTAYSVPLDYVVIAHDTAKYRPLIIVTPS